MFTENKFESNCPYSLNRFEVCFVYSVYRKKNSKLYFKYFRDSFLNFIFWTGPKVTVTFRKYVPFVPNPVYGGYDNPVEVNVKEPCYSTMYSYTRHLASRIRSTYPPSSTTRVTVTTESSPVPVTLVFRVSPSSITD